MNKKMHALGVAIIAAIVYLLVFILAYIHYEAPVEEQNFSTLIEFLNAMEVREDDEEFQNPVDQIGRARVGKECRSRWSPYH